MSAVWVDESGWLVSQGVAHQFDPGTGQDRYRRAIAALDGPAFASFTFDPEEPGSVVVVAERVAHTPIEPAPPPGGRVIDDGIAAWRSGFQRAMEAIRGGLVSKVVLARQVVIGLDAPLDVPATVASLARANPGCFSFAVGGLLGATPELLVSLRSGRVATLALAGTATDPVGLDTVKISEEHRHVADSVAAALTPHLSGVDRREQVIVTHGAMSHVGTRIEGPARPGVTVADLLAALHPTAAVAGSPAPQALEIIREIEPATRGRYAGPVGWLAPDGDGVFALALRCGQLDGLKLTLFAGGGLVAGSEEEAELAETELKLAPMLAVVGQLSS